MRTESELAAKYTLSKPVAVRGEPDARTVWIKVGVQSFRLDGHSEDESAAEWMRGMIGKALANIVAEETAGLTESLKAAQDVIAHLRSFETSQPAIPWADPTK